MLYYIPPLLQLKQISPMAIRASSIKLPKAAAAVELASHVSRTVTSPPKSILHPRISSTNTFATLLRIFPASPTANIGNHLNFDSPANRTLPLQPLSAPPLHQTTWIRPPIHSRDEAPAAAAVAGVKYSHAGGSLRASNLGFVCRLHLENSLSLKPVFISGFIAYFKLRLRLQVSFSHLKVQFLPCTLCLISQKHTHFHLLRGKQGSGRPASIFSAESRATTYPLPSSLALTITLAHEAGSHASVKVRNHGSVESRNHTSVDNRTLHHLCSLKLSKVSLSHVIESGRHAAAKDSLHTAISGSSTSDSFPLAPAFAAHFAAPSASQFFACRQLNLSPNSFSSINLV
ncbi:hypothetical protein KSP39_PZI017930 [Platanthera zijinensis]|uniref:Uncharacterized protein n=1 Tax=Platanthera zijinensis TaxID=2320716 RepID=A0AAP0B598_9ASPA